MSFAVDLIAGFEQVSRYTEDGLKHLKDVISFFRKRAHIEEEYAKNLAKLVQSFKSLVPESKRLPFEARRDPQDYRSLWVAWYQNIEEAQNIAFQHEQVSNQITVNVLEPLQNTLKDLEHVRKQAVTEGQRQIKLLQDAHSALQKAQATNSAAQKELEEFQEVSEKARNNFQTKDSTLSKLQGKEASIRDKAESAQRALHEHSAECATRQRDHYTTHMPAILQSLENNELERCTHLKFALLEIAKMNTARAHKIHDVCDVVTTLVRDTDIRVDLMDFITRHKTSNEIDVPITSILAPTIKGHLACRFQDSSKWKDLVFVLVGVQRRLYCYESEDSLHPREVIHLPRGDRAVRPADHSLFNRSNTFQIITSSRTYYLSASDGESCNAWMTALREVCIETIPGFDKRPHIVRSFEVKVIEAKDLHKPGDYYCLVLLDSEKQARTLTKGNTQAPFWNQAFTFDDVPSSVRTFVLQIFKQSSNISSSIRKLVPGRSFDESTAKEKDSDLLIGHVAVHVASLSKGQAYDENWHEILSQLSEVSNVGSLRLRISHADEYVRPIASYAPLLTALFSPSRHLILRALEKSIGTVDRTAACTALVHVAHHNQCLLALVEEFCRIDLENTTDPKTLFRGNSFASKIIELFLRMKTVDGGRYLEHALGPTIRSIYEAKPNCEVDITRLSSQQAGDQQKELQANWKRLLQYTNLCWNSIVYSMDNCPVEIKRMFSRVRAAVHAKFPADGDAQRSSIAGFFFLRLVCPALLGPQLFNLEEHHPEDTTARTLTLISKTIQTLANGVPFGQKEPFMLPMNEFIEANRARMILCLDKLSDAPTHVELHVSTAIDHARATASLLRILHRNLKGLIDMQIVDEHLSQLIEAVEILQRGQESDIEQHAAHELLTVERGVVVGEPKAIYSAELGRPPSPSRSSKVARGILRRIRPDSTVITPSGLAAAAEFDASPTFRERYSAPVLEDVTEVDTKLWPRHHSDSLRPPLAKVVGGRLSPRYSPSPRTGPSPADQSSDDLDQSFLSTTPPTFSTPGHTTSISAEPSFLSRSPPANIVRVCIFFFNSFSILCLLSWLDVFIF
eukprot:m.594931 g.594931  ORF g.594931 m.594931 type:complete len:1080 (-) comp58037_c0_seq2:86-3325(-)